MPERRWSGAFRVCPDCAKRNFVGRSRCSACGVLLARPMPAPFRSPMSFIGLRGSDRFQGRGVAAVGGAALVLALAGGLLVHRLLRGPDSVPAPDPVAASRAATQPTPPTWETEAPLPRRPEDRANHEKGRRLLAAGDPKGALRPLIEVARRFPRDPAVVHDYGVALVRAGDPDRGIFQLEHASRLAPGNGTYRIDLIRALVAAKRSGPAGRELRALLERDPANVEALALQAQLTESASVHTSGDPGGVDLGGASGSAAPSPANGSLAFTNEDLKRRRPTASPPAER